MLTFFPFPRTRHLPSSQVLDSDRTMSCAELRRLCDECEIIIQEKIDGANVSVYFSDQDVPVCQKRSRLIDGAAKQRDQYAFFRNWVWEHREALLRVAQDRFVLFGELCWQTHGLKYTRLQDWVVCFDLFDRVGEVYLTHEAMAELLGDDFPCVPLL